MKGISASASLSPALSVSVYLSLPCLTLGKPVSTEEIPVVRSWAPSQQPHELAILEKALQPQSHFRMTTAPAAILTTTSRDAPLQSNLATHHEFLTHRT